MASWKIKNRTISATV